MGGCRAVPFMNVEGQLYSEMEGVGVDYIFLSICYSSSALDAISLMMPKNTIEASWILGLL